MTGSPRITFTPLARDHFPLLARWLAVPAVRAWWLSPEPTVAAVEADYGEVVDGTDPMKAFVVEVDGEPAGLVQSFRHAEEAEYDAEVGIPGVAGIDYLIGETAHRGRGVGTAAVRAFAVQVLGFYPDVSGVVAVPLRANRASCRVLEKAGFRHVEDLDLDTGDPSDVGVNSVYLLARDAVARTA